MITDGLTNSVINRLIDDIHNNAVEHGWWEEERSFGDICALVHCEVSEAMEEYRNGHSPTEIYRNEDDPRKPEGIPIELADVIIRIFDYCGEEDIDIVDALLIKHAYNKTRPYKHGGKKL